MANVERLSVSLSEDLAEMVRGAVSGGGYTSSSEVVREALRDWRLKQALREAGVERLRKEWAQGISDLENGRSTTITTEEDAKALLESIKKRGRKKLATQRTE